MGDCAVDVTVWIAAKNNNTKNNQTAEFEFQSGLFSLPHKFTCGNINPFPHPAMT